MAIIEGGTSGAAISTGQGQGYAQVLGQSSFDPVAFVENVAAKEEVRRQKQWAEDLKMRERNSKVKPYVPKVNQYNREELSKDLDDMTDVMAKMAASDVDLGSPEAQALIARAEMGIKDKEATGAKIETKVLDYAKMVADHPEKFSLEELNAWNEKLDKQPTVADRIKFVQNNTPFDVPLADLNKIEKDIATTIGLDTIENDGETVGQWPVEKVKARVDTYLQNLSPNEQQSLYEEGKKRGKWDSPEKMREVVVQEVLPMGNKTVSQDEPRISGGGGLTFNSGGGVENGKWRATPAFSENFAYNNKGENNVITINPTTGAETKPFELYDGSGKPVYTKVASIRKYNSNTTNSTAEASKKAKEIENEIKGLATQGTLTKEQRDRKKELETELNTLKSKPLYKQTEKGGQQSGSGWIIEGTRAKRITGEQATALKNANPEKFLNEYTPVEGEDNTYISITENEPVKIPISPIRGEKGFDNYQRIVGMTGIDLKDMMGTGGGSPASSNEKQSSGKTVSRSQIKSLVGTPGYEGYTEQELIDYYKGQGITIK